MLAGSIGPPASLNTAMVDVLATHGDIDALACVDLRSGAVLMASARDARFRNEIDSVAQVICELCTAPRLDSPNGEDEAAREVLIVSDRAVNAFTRSKRHANRAIVGLARSRANIALVLVALRGLAAVLDGEAP